MAIVENLKVNVDVDGGAKSLKQLKAEFKETQTALEGLDTSSKEYTATLKKLANTKDEIEDLNDAIKSQMGAGKFEAFSKVGSSIASGFAAATGAAALFGSKSEEVEQALLKVQAAMAFADGLKGLEGLGDAFNNAKTVAIDFGKSAVTALKGIKTGIAATGIGLLVLALGALVTYWDDIKAAMNGVSDEQEKLNKSSEENLIIQQKKLDAIGGQDNILKLQGKSEKDILKIKIAQTDETIKAAETAILQSEQTRDSQVKAAKSNKDILKGMLDFVSIPLTLLLAGIDKIGSVFGKDFNLLEGFKETVSNLIFDPEQIEKDANESIDKAKEGLAKLKNDRAGFQLAINNIDNTAHDKAKATKAAATVIKDAEEKAAKEASAKIDEDYRVSQLTADQKSFEEFAKIQKAYLDNKNITQDEYNERTKAKKEQLDNDAKQKEQDINEAKAKQTLEDSTTEVYSVIQGTGAYKIRTVVYKDGHMVSFSLAEEGIKEEKAKKRAAALAATNLTLESTKQLNDGLQSMSDIYFTNKLSGVKKGSKEEEAILRKQFEVNKKLQISNAVITGIQNGLTAYGAGLTAATAGGPATAALAPIWGAAYAAISAVGSMAAIAKIKATQFGSSASTSADSGGGNIGSFSQSGMNNGVNNTSTNLNANGTVNTPPVKVYVTQTDIHSANDTVEKIKTKALIE